MRYPADFPIAARWRARHPERLQFYGAPTPNGVKISIMLEETGLPYESHFVDIGQAQSKDPAFLALNPNGRIPAIIDPDGPDGRPLPLWESGAILIYLAEKTGSLIPADPIERHAAIQWLFFQVSAIGPMFGQLGYFERGDGRSISDKRPRDRFLAESRRLLGVLETQLEGRDWLAGAGSGEFSIADIATIGWVRALDTNYRIGDLVGLSDFHHVGRWLAGAMRRPAVVQGLGIPRRE